MTIEQHKQMAKELIVIREELIKDIDETLPIRHNAKDEKVCKLIDGLDAIISQLEIIINLGSERQRVFEEVVKMFEERVKQ